MDMQTVAREACETFTRGKRDDGSAFWTTSDDGWIRDAIMQAHGDMLPDDHVYSFCREAFEAIADGEDDSFTFADNGVDVYNSALLEWLGSHSARQGFCDDAAEELGEAEGVMNAIQRGQYMERAEVFDVIWQACEEHVEELVTEHDAEGDRKWAEIQATRAKMGLEPNPRPNR